MRRWGETLAAVQLLATERGTISPLMVSQHLGIRRDAASWLCRKYALSGYLRKLGRSLYAPVEQLAPATELQRALNAFRTAGRALSRRDLRKLVGGTVGAAGSAISKLRRGGLVRHVGLGLYEATPAADNAILIYRATVVAPANAAASRRSLRNVTATSLRAASLHAQPSADTGEAAE